MGATANSLNRVDLLISSETRSSAPLLRGDVAPLLAVVASERAGWAQFGIDSAWSPSIRWLRTDGENADKYLVIFSDESGQPQKQLLIKHYVADWVEPTTIESEYQGLHIVSAAFQRTGRFRAPIPYSRRPEQKLLFMEYCPSIQLNRWFLKSLRLSRLWLSPTVRATLLSAAADVGTMLAEFQRIPRTEKVLTEALLSEYRAAFLRYLESCRQAELPERLLCRIRAYVLERLCFGPASPPVVNQHCDFGPWNILICDQHLYMTDFGNFRAGLLSFDAAFFYTAFDLFGRNRTVDRPLLRTLQDSFLSAFRDRSAVTDSHLELFRPFRIMHMCYFAGLLLNRSRRLTDPLHAVPPRQFVTHWFDEHLDAAC
jgi:hypothetical protein